MSRVNRCVCPNCGFDISKKTPSNTDWIILHLKCCKGLATDMVEQYTGSAPFQPMYEIVQFLSRRLRIMTKRIQSTKYLDPECTDDPYGVRDLIIQGFYIAGYHSAYLSSRFTYTSTSKSGAAYEVLIFDKHLEAVMNKIFKQIGAWNSDDFEWGME